MQTQNGSPRTQSKNSKISWWYKPRPRCRVSLDIEPSTENLQVLCVHLRRKTRRSQDSRYRMLRMGAGSGSGSAASKSGITTEVFSKNARFCDAVSQTLRISASRVLAAGLDTVRFPCLLAIQDRQLVFDSHSLPISVLLTRPEILSGAALEGVFELSRKPSVFPSQSDFGVRLSTPGLTAWRRNLTGPFENPQFPL